MIQREVNEDIDVMPEQIPEKSEIDALREKQIHSVQWAHLGSGEFNTVLFTEDAHLSIADEKGESDDYQGPWVGKTPSVKSDLTEHERQRRLFKAIEPDMPVRSHQGRTFFLPYFSKNDGWKQASKLEIAVKCLEIFKRTGRILMDASVMGNLLSKNGKTVCVDVDVAVRPDSPLSFNGFFNMNTAYQQLRNKMSWYEVLKTHSGLHASEDPDKKVLLGLIDLSEYYGEEAVPEALLTLEVMQELHVARKKKQPLDEGLIGALMNVTNTYLAV